ncbi:hypothetical protein D3C86_1195790 [compost metagenome]
MMKTLPASPMPNQRIAIGIQASGEIGRNSSTSGSSTLASRGRVPCSSPSGIATSAASSQAASTRPRLAPMSRKIVPDANRSYRVYAVNSGEGSTAGLGWVMTTTASHTSTTAIIAAR